MAIGAKLHELRVGKRMTVDALASSAECSAAEVVRYEAGSAHIPADVLQRLCEALGVEVSQFFASLASAGTTAPSRSVAASQSPQQIRAAISHMEAALTALQGASTAAATQLVEMALIELRNAMNKDGAPDTPRNGG
jgi:transcriptional regulator with XRE-family HTH domain